MMIRYREELIEIVSYFSYVIFVVLYVGVKKGNSIYRYIDLFDECM